jgi:hypothetical protein
LGVSTVVLGIGIAVGVIVVLACGGTIVYFVMKKKNG